MRSHPYLTAMSGGAGESDLKRRIAALESELDQARRECDEARAAEHRLQLFIDNARDYAFITFDKENRITSWNPGAERILKYTEAEILGKSGSTFFTPEDRDRHQPQREMAIADRDGRAEDERWHMRKDGSRFWGSGVMTALRDESGEGHGYGKVMRDLTTRREDQQRLAESEERFRLFVSSVTEYALVPVDPEGRVSGWNTGAERILGYSAEEIIGQPVSRFFGPGPAAEQDSERDLAEALTDGRSVKERWMVRKDGSHLWAQWVTTPMYDGEGQLQGFAKVLHDETERKRAQEERERRAREEREALRGKVLATGQELDRTKEELRSLATSLLTAQEEERRRVARELHDDIAQRLSLLEIGFAQFRKQVKESSAPDRAELNRLEQDIATLSGDVRRLSHQLHPAILDSLGLRVALKRLAEEFRSGRTHPVTYQADGVPDGVPLSIATAIYRIAQEALRNIGKHALQASVSIRVTGTPGQLRLRIEDSGPGFDTAAMRGQGGLGMISMQERTRLAGGSFRLHSQPGQGTTIQVEVPLHMEEA
jgi:PAS domain S-box-containing protein